MKEQDSEQVYKQVEIVGSSSQGLDEAVQNAIARASTSLRNLRWFEVASIRGGIEDQEIREWQVTIKLAFALE